MALAKDGFNLLGNGRWLRVRDRGRVGHLLVRTENYVLDWLRLGRRGNFWRRDNIHFSFLKGVLGCYATSQQTILKTAAQQFALLKVRHILILVCTCFDCRLGKRLSHNWGGGFGHFHSLENWLLLGLCHRRRN